MAPNFRQNTQTRRGNRSGYVEHDDFEGLPVRQWRQDWVNVTPPPPPDPTRKNDVWAIELPHGMPKDSQLLPNHTQELLRAARSGRLYKRPAPTEEEEAEIDPAIAEKAEKKEEDLSTKGFQIKIWKQVARSAEGPTISYLAKRRKGTVTLSSDLPAGGAAPGPTVTKATVRRIDAAGNPYTQEVTLNDGQPVDGEIISTTVVAAPAPNISGDVTITPVRRRPPPPKRKPKGPGRGRKKKLPLPLSAHATAPHPAAVGLAPGVQADGTQGSKPGDNVPKHNEQNDIEMADDDDGDDGDDGEDDGDEGDDDDEDGDGVDGETGFTPRAESEAKSDQMEITRSHNHGGETTENTRPPPSQESHPASANLSPPLPPLTHIEGSPLKQVVSAQSPIHVDPPSPGGAQKPPTAPGDAEQIPHTTEPASVPAPIAPVVPVLNPTTLNESLEATAAPAAGADVGTDLDVDMQDVAPTFAEISTEETMTFVTANNSVALPGEQEEPSAQPVEPTHQSPTALPADEAVQDEMANVEPPLEIAGVTEAAEVAGVKPSLEIAGLEGVAIAQVDDVGGSGNVVEANSPVGLANPDLTDTLVEPLAFEATDSLSIDEKLAPAPASTEPQGEQPVLRVQEEIAANSPDLFSDLEAALNQHGHSGSEPIPDTSEAVAPKLEPTSLSE
ncbi:putative lyr family protein [Rosellinia necatrix]|uniref:Putative lyr family protein n=1 Tax=Rosellinia necatrix TaxID=77044 RepID=A0A1W2TS56_ROSNE|nr:putative lyr family protein [Rosellinia necatrix]